MEESRTFSDVKFILTQCNDPDAIKAILLDGGAKHINYLSEHVTHVIADTNCPEAEEAVELFDKPVVRSLWVHLSSRAKRLLPTEAFSPIKSIFNNVTASFSKDLSDSDVESLAATLTYYGGKVAKDISCATHLITPTVPSDEKLSSSSGQLRVVGPDWVLNSIQQNCHLDETNYDPSLLLGPPPPTPTPPPPKPVTNNSHTESNNGPSDTLQSNDESAAKQQPPQKPQQMQSRPPNQYSQQSGPNEQIKIQQNQHQPLRPQSQQQQVRQQELQQQYSPQQQKQMQPQMRPQTQTPPHQQQQPPQLQLQVPPSQVYQQQPSQQSPRSRMPTNVIRGSQPRFRPILPNAPMMQRQIPQPQRIMVPDPQQQPKKVTINYGNQYRKVNPYQNNIDASNQPSYQTQHAAIHQQPNQVPTRPQQPQQQQQHVQHQIRMPYQNDPMTPHGPGHHPIVNQTQHTQQPMQIVNRFQDSNTNAGQRPYQMCVQSQPANSNYQQVNLQRQPIYYSPGPGTNQVHIRMSQQGQFVRPIRSESGVYNQSHSVQEPGPRQLQHHYVGNAPPQPHISPQQQPQTQQQQQNQQQFTQHQPPHNIASNHSKDHSPDFQQQMTVHQNTKVIRPMLINQEPRQQYVRIQNPTQLQDRSKATIAFNNAPLPPPPTQVQNQTIVINQQMQSQQQQPHPSIFDHVQESNLAQIRAKVPVVTEKMDYLGYETKDDVPSDLPLIGCRFKMIDYESHDVKLKKRWCNAIVAAGGLFKDEIHEITHLICENRASEVYSQASKLGVRCVTIHWVNDVCRDNRLHYPWKALHLPTAFPKTNRPLKDQIIATTNLKNRDRLEMRQMIIKAGGRYTEYFSTSNTLLICGRVGGDKYERALEWKTPLANCQIISDVLLSTDLEFSKMLMQPKYQLFGDEDPLKLKSYSLVEDLMLPWKKALIWDKNETKPSLDGMKEEGGEDKTIQKSETKNESSPAKSQQTGNNIENSLVNGTTDSEPNRQPRKSNEPVRLLFTSLTENLKNQLSTFAQSLGLSFASSPIDCTHLIVDKISRTPKFVCAFNYATHILSYKWLLDSYRAKQILDERQYVLQDNEGEEKFSFNLVHSLLKRRKRGGLLFKDFIFFATPSVKARVINLKEMIDSAGAVLTTRKLPSKVQLEQINRSGKRFVVITNEDDIHLCLDIEQLGVDLVDVEFVISGILRQDIDFDAHRIKSSQATFTKPRTTPIINNSPKRLKIGHSQLKTDLID